MVREVEFDKTYMAWNVGSRFCIDWNSLDKRKSAWYQLEWLGPEEVSFVSTRMAWAREPRFCIDLNVWDRRKSVLY